MKDVISAALIGNSLVITARPYFTKQKSMSILQRLQARMQRWHLLGRYYANKWHYDGSKWMDCVLYGQGSTGNGPQVASVAFMITRAMRQQLMDVGFPPSAISSLQPAVAQQLIADKTSFAQFKELQKQQQVEKAAEKAKQTLRQEEEQEHQQEQSVVLAKEEMQQTIEHQEEAETSALVIRQEKVVKEEDVKKSQS
ncbi:unnamed protein product [Peronospora effusa]|uniref:Uncharacterized protein n=1 Tax=Peronospora effusa TaxID=542832 RepID=A0A3M6VMC5_9STRA|nr:hypothetical protein DD238_002886 [Peronospora effusa]RQM09855.1 hypothetical protein DD237_002087 [Peronospora effusa]CAI5719819.1 unnamed protein product [Peronospora effusa]